MMLGRLWLMGVAVCATGHAFAQEVTPATPATPAATAPQPATPAQTSSPAAAPSKPLAEGEFDADKIMAAQKAGYKIKNENGKTLLCRRDLQTGSHTRYRTSCLTAQEWEQLKNDNEQILKAIERRPRMTRQ
jgi:predicted transglutaminase-like cysteine proteinase